MKKIAEEVRDAMRERYKDECSWCGKHPSEEHAIFCTGCRKALDKVGEGLGFRKSELEDK